MKPYLKYLLSISILFCIPSSVYACGWCIDEQLLWYLPPVIFVLPLYILWLIVITILAIIDKRPSSDKLYTAHPPKKKILTGWLLIPIWIGAAIVFSGSVTLPSVILCVIWLVYLLRQLKDWTRVKEQPKEGKLFIWIHSVTIAILFVVGIGIFIYSRTPQGLRFYFKWDVEPARGLLKDKYVELLEDRDGGVRARAVEKLGHSGNKEFAHTIVKLLNDQEFRVRQNVVEALDKLKATEYTDDIARLLSDKHSIVRTDAIEVLGKFGAKKYAPAIAKLLQDNDDFVRWKAVEALNKLDAKEYSNDIIKLLNDKDEWVRKTAIETLGKWGVKEGIKEIVKLLDDKDVWVRKTAVEIIGNSGEKEYAKDIYKLLQDKDEDVRKYASIALTKLELNNPKNEITKRLESNNRDVCFGAVYALANSGADAKPYAANIFKLLTHSDLYIRGYAVQSLGESGAKEYIADIAKLLDDENSWVQGQTVRSLGLLGAKEYAVKIAKLLEEWSEIDYPWLREVAAWSLGELKVKETLEPLKRQLLKEKDDEVREAIQRTIQNIEPEKGK